MKIVRSLTKWTLIAVAGGVLLVVLVLAGIFAFTRLTDEALDPRAQQLLAANPATAFESAPAKSKDHINAFHVVIAGPFAGTLQELETRGLATLSGDRRQQSWPEFWCKKDQLASCVRVWSAMTEDERRAVLAQSPGYASNLEEILRLRYAEDSPGARFDAPIPDMRGILALQLVSMATVLDRIDRMDRDSAIELLQQQIAFNRRALSGSTTIIGKMITVAAVERDVLFVRELAARRPADLRANDALALLAPLTDAERSMSSPCRMETAMTVRAVFTVRPTDMFEELPQLSTLAPLTPLLFTVLNQPNATANILLKRGDECEAVAALDAKSFRDKRPSMAHEKVSQWNWAGDLFLMDALVTEYPARLHDLDTLLALVRADLGGEDHDPSTGQPFRRAGQARSFIPLGASSAVKLLTRNGAVLLEPIDSL